MSDTRLPAKSTLCSGSLYLSIEIGSMWHGCRLHLVSPTLMSAKMAFWRGEQPYCHCLQPCFVAPARYNVFVPVSNKDVLLAALSCFVMIVSFFVLRRTVCCHCCLVLFGPEIPFDNKTLWLFELPHTSARGVNVSHRYVTDSPLLVKSEQRVRCLPLPHVQVPRGD